MPMGHGVMMRGFNTTLQPLRLNRYASTLRLNHYASPLRRNDLPASRMTLVSARSSIAEV